LAQGPTDLMIKVENNEEKYFYEWTVTIFKHRVFLIREILDDYFESGKKPTFSKVDDPFWDPPNPILIGHSYLSLGALGFVLDSDVDAAIISIDGTKSKNGMLSVGYDQCDANGKLYCQDKVNKDPQNMADMPDDLFVQNDVDELLKYEKEFYFKVRVKQAISLPKDLNNNAFVRYQF